METQKTEDQKALLQVGLDIMKDLSAEIRHCDIIALTFVTLNATICGSVVVGLFNVSFQSLYSSIGFLFLAILFIVQVGVFRGLKARVDVSGAKITFIRAAIAAQYPMLDMPILRVNSEVKTRGFRPLDIPYMYRALSLYSLVVGGFAFFVNLYSLISNPVTQLIFAKFSGIKY